MEGKTEWRKEKNDVYLTDIEEQLMSVIGKKYGGRCHWANQCGDSVEI